jgi:cbb3-type cytochrome oxidase subunit 3
MLKTNTDLQHSTSRNIWLYFVFMVPLTIFFVGGWWRLDRARGKNVDEEAEDGDEEHMLTLENHIMKALKRRTGAQLSWKVR